MPVMHGLRLASCKAARLFPENVSPSTPDFFNSFPTELHNVQQQSHIKDILIPYMLDSTSLQRTL